MSDADRLRLMDFGSPTVAPGVPLLSGTTMDHEGTNHAVWLYYTATEPSPFTGGRRDLSIFKNLSGRPPTRWRSS